VVWDNYTSLASSAPREELCKLELGAVQRALIHDKEMRVRFRETAGGGSIKNNTALLRLEGLQQEGIDAIQYVLSGHKEYSLVALAKIQRAMGSISFERGVMMRAAPWVFTAGDARSLLQCLGHRHLAEAPVEEAPALQGTLTGSTPTTHFIEGDIATTSQEELNRVIDDMSLGKMWSGEKWEHGRVHYCFAPGVSERVVQTFEHARAHIMYEVSSCIHFHLVPVVNDSEIGMPRCETLPSIIVHEKQEADAGCWSHVGRASLQGESQILQIGPGCEFSGLVAHQIMHALGMLHIQPHPVAIKMHIDAMRSSNERGEPDEALLLDVEKDAANTTALPQANARDAEADPYDFFSLMHMHSFAWAKDSHITLEPQQPWMVRYMGQRYGLSPLDVKRLKVRYECSAPSTSALERELLLLDIINSGLAPCWDSRERLMPLPELGANKTYDCSHAEDMCAAYEDASATSVVNVVKEMCPNACGECPENEPVAGGDLQGAGIMSRELAYDPPLQRVADSRRWSPSGSSSTRIAEPYFCIIVSFWLAWLHFITV